MRAQLRLVPLALAVWLASSASVQAAEEVGRPAHPLPQLASAGLNQQAAIKALGSHLPAVAASYGQTAEAFAALLKHDNRLHLDGRGRLYAVDHLESALPDIEPQKLGTANILPAASLAKTFKLHSKAGSKRTIYLNFVGATLSNNAWVSGSVAASPFSMDADVQNFSSEERSRIQKIWQRVAEDFAPFDVDVTTEAPAAEALTRSSSSDDVYGTTVLITNSTGVYNCSCGGVAYIGVFDNVGDYYKPALVFYNQLYSDEKYVAEAISHEAGHNLGLFHDGTSSQGYYAGHGSGATGWAPIMGVGYYQPVVQWSKGEYADANNTEDDFVTMASNGLNTRADDHGDSLEAASTLTTTTNSAGGQTLSATGIISTSTDQDVFAVTVEAGQTLKLRVLPDTASPNLDVAVKLLDANGVVKAKSQPKGSLGTQLQLTPTVGGTYFLTVTGSSFGDPAATGYSRYGSLGQYRVSGSIQP